MKIYISKYRYHWISPYKILEKVFFWREIDYDEPTIEKWSDRLEPISKAIQTILDFIHPKINYVKIDPWDTWSMDCTLSPIILPMLKQLKETKHGAPHVDDEDVPEELKSTSAPPKENEWDTDDNWFKRWDWVMDQMIFSFECLSSDEAWDSEFHTGVHDLKTEPCEWDENGKPKLYRMVPGPNHTAKFDEVGYKIKNDKLNNGLRLFGKYYRGLWD